MTPDEGSKPPSARFYSLARCAAWLRILVIPIAAFTVVAILGVLVSDTEGIIKFAWIAGFVVQMGVVLVLLEAVAGFLELALDAADNLDRVAKKT